LGVQLVGQFGKFRPGLLSLAQVGGAERVFFEGDEMQSPAALCIVAPGLPGGQEVEAQPEAGFQNDETFPALTIFLPALRQVVAGEKHMPRLRRSAMGRVIDIVVGAGVRRADGGEFQAGRLQFFH
jgi:hypothetical protein